MHPATNDPAIPAALVVAVADSADAGRRPRSLDHLVPVVLGMDVMSVLAGLFGPGGWLLFLLFPCLAVLSILLGISWVGMIVVQVHAATVSVHALILLAMVGFFLVHSDFGDSPDAAAAPLESMLHLAPMSLAGWMVVTMGAALLLALGACIAAFVGRGRFSRRGRAGAAY